LLTSLEISLEIAYVPVLKYKNKGEIMGRAIDMEKDISAMKIQIEKLQNQLRGMVSRIDEIDDIIDSVEEDILEEESSEKVEDNLGSVITGDYEDEKEEANTEGSDKGDGEPDKRSSKSKSKTNK